MKIVYINNEGETIVADAERYLGFIRAGDADDGESAIVGKHENGDEYQFDNIADAVKKAEEEW